MGDLLITGGAVLTMAPGGQIFDPGDVAIRDGKIIYVGRAEEGIYPPDWNPDQVLRATNKIVLPGFINAHTHAAMTLFRGYGDDLPLQKWLQEKIWPLEAKLTAEDVYWGTLLALGEMLKAGVTTFADMYFFPDTIAQAVSESGIRACLSQGLLGILPDPEKALVEGVEFCKRWGGAAGGRITTMLGPHAPYTCPPEYLQEVIREARNLGVGIHIHLAETETEIREIQANYGSHPVSYLIEQDLQGLHVLAAHCVYLEEEEIGLLTKENIHVVHNPGSNLKLASGIAPVPKLLEEGINVALGTDGASSNNNLDLLEEARLAALLHKGFSKEATVLPARQALGMATFNGAAALGLGDTCGSLQSGMKADLILINRNNRPHLWPAFDPFSAVIYSAQSGDVDTVLVDGRIVVQKGQVCTLDLERITAMADQSAKRLANLT